MKILDLFSGIGGFSLAAQRAGFEIDKHYAAEIDKYAQMIYRRNFNGSIQLGDITGIGNELGKIDIITGGFPCQAFSIAGKRRGFEDTRGTLFFEIERLCRFYRPSYMVLENVKGLASHEGGDTIRVILDKLRGLDYSVQLLLLNTKDFGIPQNRERFFFICTARGKRQPEISGIRERKTEIAQGITAISTRHMGLRGPEYSNGLMQCLTATGYKDQHKVKVGTLRTHKDGEGFREVKSGLCPTIPARAREDGSGQPIISIPVLSPDRVEKRQNGRRFKENGEPSFTLTAQDRHGVMVSRKDPVKPIDTALCLNSTDWRGLNRNQYQNAVVEDSIIRRLTPVECERLQDYPDNWTKFGTDENGKEVEISDTQRYKTCGNSITVKVAEEIFKAIKKVYNSTNSTDSLHTNHTIKPYIIDR